MGASLGVSLGSVGLRVDLDADGRLRYAVTYGQRPVVQPSRLGLRLAEGPGSDGGPGFDGPLRLLGHDTATVDSTWQPVWGEEASIRTHYRQLTLHLCPLAAPARRLDLVFRVFADGVGFRYELPAQPALRFLVVAAELTEFALPVDPTAFWLPGDEDSNEYPYAITPLSQVDNAALVRASTDIAVRAAPDPQAVQTPLLLHYPTGPYVALHEAAQVNYPALQLHVDGPAHRLTARLVPDAGGAAAYLRTPARTPWRTVLIGARAADLLTSRLILNLNEPSTIADPSWIHPMKFVGVWWEMQTGRGTWSYANRADTLDAQGRLLPHGRHSATTANVQRYIDFAAQHHIPGVLVEGWNTGWEDWFGHWQEDVFDFVTPYPDFDVAGLQRYAQARGVQLIMHHETAGAATGYEQRLDSAYRFMTRFGYPAVKTGYVGRIVPRGEHHDGQWMSNHYVRVAQAAARHRLLVDMHEPTRPSGLQRTYPNWLASEAGRGNEYNAFTAAGNAPNPTIHLHPCALSEKHQPTTYATTCPPVINRLLTTTMRPRNGLGASSEIYSGTTNDALPTAAPTTDRPKIMPPTLVVHDW